MHRSGTSCLTGSLQEAGLDLGEHSTWNLHNRKGNRENPSIVDFHEAVLADNKGAWHDPPRRIIWSDQHTNIAREILVSHAENDIWGFKDPRFLLMENQWRSLITNPVYIGIFRHPYLVARSINKRGSGIISLQRGLELWYIYNKKLLQIYQRAPFPIICFDDDQLKFQQQVLKSIDILGLNELNGNMNFYSDDLVSNRLGDQTTKLPLKIRFLYRKLQKLAIKE